MIPADAGRPACADRLDLVDAAFERGKAGNGAGRELARLCRSCPVAEACAAEFLARREYGTWAGMRRSLGQTSLGSPPAGRIRAVA